MNYRENNCNGSGSQRDQESAADMCSRLPIQQSTSNSFLNAMIRAQFLDKSDSHDEIKTGHSSEPHHGSATQKEALFAPLFMLSSVACSICFMEAMEQEFTSSNSVYATVIGLFGDLEAKRINRIDCIKQILSILQNHETLVQKFLCLLCPNEREFVKSVLPEIRSARPDI